MNCNERHNGSEVSPKVNRRNSIVKRLNKNKHFGENASIKTLKRYCFEIWSELVKERDGHKCVMCGETSYLNSHHLISRKNLETAFLLINGITLCSCRCHDMGLYSAHVSPWYLEKWIMENRKEQYNWFLKERFNIKHGTKIDYKESLNNLLKEYDLLKPKEIIRSKYFQFTEEEEKQIVEEYKINSIGLIQNTHKCSGGCVREILKRNNIPLNLERNILNKRLAQGHPVLKLDLQGNILQEYLGIRQASLENGLSSNAVYNCLTYERPPVKNRKNNSGRKRKEFRTSGGFRWKFKDV